MQFAHKADGLALQQHARAAARVQCRVRCWLERGCSGASSKLDITLGIVEVHRLVLAAPLQRIDRTIGQARDPHRLREAFHRAVGVRTLASRRNTRPSSNTRTRPALRSKLNLSTCSKEPSSDERMTLRWLAIGLSSLIGAALPASSFSQCSSTKLKLMAPVAQQVLN